MSQQDRRREPYPWTWEPTAVIGATLLTVVVTAVQLGRAAANLAVGGAFTLPSTFVGWVTSTPAVLAGHAGFGLPPHRGVTTTPVAGPVLLGWSIAAIGLVILSLVVTGAVAGWRRFGGGGVQGMAKPAEVRSTLGLRRLQQNSRLIRPDLHQRRTGVGT